MATRQQKISYLQDQIKAKEKAISGLQEYLNSSDHQMAAYYDYRYNSKITGEMMGDPKGFQFTNILQIEETRSEITQKIYRNRQAIKDLQAKIQTAQDDPEDLPVG